MRPEANRSRIQFLASPAQHQQVASAAAGQKGSKESPDMFLLFTCDAGFGLAARADASRWVEDSAGAVSRCGVSEFCRRPSFTFTVQWRGGKARDLDDALTLLALNKLLRLCSTLGVGDHICDCLATLSQWPLLFIIHCQHISVLFPSILVILNYLS